MKRVTPNHERFRALRTRGRENTVRSAMRERSQRENHGQLGRWRARKIKRTTAPPTPAQKTARRRNPRRSRSSLSRLISSHPFPRERMVLLTALLSKGFPALEPGEGALAGYRLNCPIE
jgi:hypothetical protein